MISDGPYPEVKDVIGGYYMIDAQNDAEAKAVALECPHLWSTNWVELRPVDRTSVAEAQAHGRAMSISSGVDRQ